MESEENLSLEKQNSEKNISIENPASIEVQSKTTNYNCWPRLKWCY